MLAFARFRVQKTAAAPGKPGHAGPADGPTAPPKSAPESAKGRAVTFVDPPTAGPRPRASRGTPGGRPASILRQTTLCFAPRPSDADGCVAPKSVKVDARLGPSDEFEHLDLDSDTEGPDPAPAPTPRPRPRRLGVAAAALKKRAAEEHLRNTMQRAIALAVANGRDSIDGALIRQALRRYR